MIEKIIEHMDLQQIAESGQCFRWQRLERAKPTYSIVAGRRYIEVTQKSSSTFVFSCTEAEYRGFWANYFDLYRDYEYYQVLATRNGSTLLQTAAQAGSGIRILQQDAWEMLITFLIAQNITITRVTAIIEKLCKRYGTKRIDKKTQATYYTFPPAERLSYVPPEELRAMGVGYRDKQIANAAKICSTAAFKIQELWRADYDTCKLLLKNILGVGDKVADCICLFGLKKMESYPIDTWVKKIDEYYGEGYIKNKFPECAGIMQQYLFAYVREYGLPEREG